MLGAESDRKSRASRRVAGRGRVLTFGLGFVSGSMISAFVVGWLALQIRHPATPLVSAAVPNTSTDEQPVSKEDRQITFSTQREATPAASSSTAEASRSRDKTIVATISRSQSPPEVSAQREASADVPSSRNKTIVATVSPPRSPPEVSELAAGSGPASRMVVRERKLLPLVVLALRPRESRPPSQNPLSTY